MFKAQTYKYVTILLFTLQFMLIYYLLCLKQDVRQEIEQLYNAKTISIFLQKALTLSLEKKAGTQKTIGTLIASLMDVVDRLLAPEVIAEQ